MRFDRVMLVGSGKIAKDCLEYLLTLVNSEFLVVLETGDNSLSLLERKCQSHEVVYLHCMERISDCILNCIEGKCTLIISANNRFIFTPDIINSAGTEIINFHYSLLPHYRGMNIPTWVIFNQEKRTGITWHFVTEQIDYGKIINQKVIDIKEKTTAFDIAHQGMMLGIEAFKEFIGELLEKKIEGQEVIYPVNESVYKNVMLPMDGMLELPQPIEIIIRMLHCYDYGRAEVIPKLKVKYKEKIFTLEKYKEQDMTVCNDAEYRIENGKLIIQEEQKEVIMFLTPLLC